MAEDSEKQLLNATGSGSSQQISVLQALRLRIKLGIRLRPRRCGRRVVRPARGRLGRQRTVIRSRSIVLQKLQSPVSSLQFSRLQANSCRLAVVAASAPPQAEKKSAGSKGAASSGEEVGRVEGCRLKRRRSRPGRRAPLQLPQRVQPRPRLPREAPAGQPSCREGVQVAASRSDLKRLREGPLAEGQARARHRHLPLRGRARPHDQLLEAPVHDC